MILMIMMMRASPFSIQQQQPCLFLERPPHQSGLNRNRTAEWISPRNGQDGTAMALLMMPLALWPAWSFLLTRRTINCWWIGWRLSKEETGPELEIGLIWVLPLSTLRSVRRLAWEIFHCLPTMEDPSAEEKKRKIEETPEENTPPKEKERSVI